MFSNNNNRVLRQNKNKDQYLCTIWLECSGIKVTWPIEAMVLSLCILFFNFGFCHPTCLSLSLLCLVILDKSCLIYSNPFPLVISSSSFLCFRCVWACWCALNFFFFCFVFDYGLVKITFNLEYILPRLVSSFASSFYLFFSIILK